MAVNEHSKRIVTSLLRYPGGKSALYTYIEKLMNQNGLKNSKYYEPFAGGAGIALGLLSSKSSSEVVLNDADYHIYCFWYALLNENSKFIDKIQNAKLTINEWQKKKAIYNNPKKYSKFDVGFAAFYLNRCNRSGILFRSGPIGGYEQKGKWKLDARFNKPNLITRAESIGEFKDRICLKNMDALDFLKNCLPRGRGRDRIFVYIDPPYISAGNRLYFNTYTNDDHKKLADYLIQQTALKWLVTYDDSKFIYELYFSCQKWVFSIGYTLQKVQNGLEVLIAPKSLRLPNKNVPVHKKINIKYKVIQRNKR